MKQSRIIVFALIAGLLGGVISSHLLSPQQVRANTEPYVHAENFQLVDKEGRLYAEIGVVEGEAFLRFFDADGKVRAVYGLPGIAIYDADEKIRISVKHNDVNSGIAVFDSSENVRSILGINQQVPFVRLLDEKGAVRSNMSASSDVSLFSMYAPDGTLRMLMGAGQDKPALEFYDGAQKKLLAIPK